MAKSARNRSPAQSYSLERDDLVFGNSGPVAPARSSRPRSLSDRYAAFREVATVPVRRPGEPAEIEILGRRHLRDRCRKAEPPSIANFKPSFQGVFSPRYRGFAARSRIGNCESCARERPAIRIHEKLRPIKAHKERGQSARTRNRERASAARRCL